jgi:hypothetical protein
MRNIVAHRGASDFIESTEGFVHQQERRIEDDGSRQSDALLHATRELMRVVVTKIRESHHLQHSFWIHDGEGGATGDLYREPNVGND